MSRSLKSARERTKSGTALRPGNVIDLEHHRAQRRPAAARTTVRVDVDVDGSIDYGREDADRVTDALLLALIEAREARAKGGATSTGNQWEQQ